VYQPSANAGDLVGNNARADAAAANRDPPFDIARSDRSGEGNDIVWIVVLRVQQGGAEVEDFMPLGAQRLGDLGLQREAAVVGGDPDAYRGYS
jgi:hypothetical protein